MPKLAATQKEPRETSRRSFFGWMWRTLFSGLAVLCLSVAVLLPLASRLDMTIHSCDIYAPAALPAIAGTSRALVAFFQQEGLSVFVEAFWHLTRMEIFRRPPYYQGDAVRGKRLLVLGGSYIPEFFDTAKRLGVHIVVVDDVSQNSWMKTHASDFIGVRDFPRISITDPEKIYELVSSRGPFDGVTTLVEDQGPLVARLAKRFGVVSSSDVAADIARNKVRFREVMQEAGLASPKFHAINSAADLDSAAQSVGLPAFLKPVFGVAAKYASTVRTLSELQSTYRLVQKEIDPVSNPIYNFGSQMMLEGIMKGSEVQLELMLHDGEIVFHCFSSEYSANRDFVVFPSNLTVHQKDKMLQMANATVRAIGLTWGVVHLEMFIENDQPQVIEVNNRLSRGFLPQQYFHQLFFGEKVVDYFGAVVFLALGMRPPLHPRTTPVASVAVFPHARSDVGWETNGPCAIFFSPTPKEALEQGISWIESGRPSESMLLLVSQLVVLGLLFYLIANVVSIFTPLSSKSKRD